MIGLQEGPKMNRLPDHTRDILYYYRNLALKTPHSTWLTLFVLEDLFQVEFIIQLRLLTFRALMSTKVIFWCVYYHLCKQF